MAALLGLARADDAAGRGATLTVCQGGATYTTIQSALGAAATGDLIQVCAGTFSEQLTINKSVTLVGAGPAQTRIAAPSPLGGDQDIVTISGDGVDVDLSGFAIAGPGPSSDCSGLLSGIFVRDGARATIHGNVITAVRNNPLDGCQKGAAIRVGRNALSTSGTASISDNLISDYQKTGIIVDGAGSTATITNNRVTGAGSTNLIAQNGIQVSRNASATVSGNEISANSYTGGGATGILLFDDLGQVSVSGNTVRGSDHGISAASVVPRVATVTISANTISGGDRGIALEGTVNTLVENNTTSGAGTFGLDADKDANGNTFRGNRASGVTGEGHYDCHDGSSGDKTAGTANTWTDNTGATASPDGICTPRTEPPAGPAPPVEVDAPEVIVLPPLPEAQANAGEVPAEVANPEQPARPAGPVAQAAANEIITSMRNDQLSSCLITLNARGQKKVLVARGLARAPAQGRGQMVIRLGVQPTGQRLLSKRVGGVLVDVRAACRTTSDKTRSGVKAARAVLAIEHVVTTPGSWVPDQPILTPIGERFVGRLSKRMIHVTRIRCDGYTATWLPSPADPETLSLARAKRVCSQLARTGITVQPRLVPHGRANPLATNDTEAGRAVNRRVAITFVHRVAIRNRR